MSIYWHQMTGKDVRKMLAAHERDVVRETNYMAAYWLAALALAGALAVALR